ncbi:MAG: hypothetical protein G01um101418_152 [Parcubacteria group bacterium Gr01-1014_18]|nr:MAG: hypothetical protein Greene041636_457 [Parcubacteria group bacterium Greene0416_36]TSC81479.1 MAG: hypothetical protein G01um101418_152 [Parcubacteria group bacterium Gr01-1014_18]TSC99077.1 MAG: hypothetical protein Greene101420_433 [Parcubacteria group bacterium Greene1014_20]
MLNRDTPFLFILGLKMYLLRHINQNNLIFQNKLIRSTHHSLLSLAKD